MADTKISKIGGTVIGVSDFLDGIFGDLESETVCVGKLGAGGGFRQMRPDEAAFSAWARRGRGGAWYFCCSAVTGARRSWDKTREGVELGDDESYLARRKELATAAFCCVMDDIGSKVSAAEADLPEASWVLETSPGNFQWGYILDPACDDWDLFDGFMALAAEEGCTDAGSRDRVHMFRLPGSENTKAGMEGFRARLEAWRPARRWSMGELLALFGFEEEECRAAGRAAHERRGKSALGAVLAGSEEGVADPVLDWLVAEGLVIEDDGRDFVQVVCPWSDLHSDPADRAAGYSPLGRGGDRHAAYRNFRCLHTHGQQHRSRDFLEWVVERGGPWAAVHDPLPWLQRRYVYVEQGYRIVDLERRGAGARDWVLAVREFGGLIGGKMMTPGRDRPVLISTAFLEDRETVKAANVVYRPGEAALFSEAGTLFVNAYVPPVHAEVGSAAPAAFLSHMEFLLPDAFERSLFLDWLAFKAQNPGRRSYGVVMVAEGYGTGRSWVADLLTRTFSGVQTISLGQLVGTSRSAQYNSWQKNTQLVVIEEARDSETTVREYYQSYETLKQVVDVRVTEGTVNDKFGALSVERQYYNVLVFTNHRDALAIPEDDRRLVVLSNPALRRGSDYYRDLWGVLDEGEPARLWHWLQSRDVAGFDSVYPPMTQAKGRMSELSVAPLDRLALSVLRSMEGDLTTWRQFLHLVRQRALEEDEEMPDGGERLLRRLYKRHTDFTDLNVRIDKGQRRERVRAVRHKGRWSKKSTSEVREEVLRNGNYAGTAATLRLISEKK